MNHGSHEKAKRHAGGQHGRLAAMTGPSFVAMYVLMYAMVNAPNKRLTNVNQLHGLMVAPTVMIELALMFHVRAGEGFGTRDLRPRAAMANGGSR